MSVKLFVSHQLETWFIRAKLVLNLVHLHPHNYEAICIVFHLNPIRSSMLPLKEVAFPRHWNLLDSKECDRLTSLLLCRFSWRLLGCLMQESSKCRKPTGNFASELVHAAFGQVLCSSQKYCADLTNQITKLITLDLTTAQYTQGTSQNYLAKELVHVLHPSFRLVKTHLRLAGHLLRLLQ